MATATDILTQIFARRRVAVEQAKASLPQRELSARVKDAEPPRAFARVMRRPDLLSLIAEIKFRSPSAGLIRDDLVIEDIAAQYEAAGADALSVLTEPEYFGGKLSDIRAAKDASRLPVLRKDFMFDPYQIYESRAAGADAILLIAAMLNDHQIEHLAGLAKELGMDVLLEVHTKEEIHATYGSSISMWGVNHRSLKTFEIDLSLTEELFPLLPKESLKVAESGIRNQEQLALMRERGADAVLVGTTLMRAPSPGKALERLRAETCG